MLTRFRARTRRRAEQTADLWRRQNDARSAQIREFIDDDLRHAHARDGIACPICGAQRGAECLYGKGQRFPGFVHTRRLMQFHAPTWPEVAQ